jgi:hypothetical protein
MFAATHLRRGSNPIQYEYNCRMQLSTRHGTRRGQFEFFANERPTESTSVVELSDSTRAHSLVPVEQLCRVPSGRTAKKAAEKDAPETNPLPTQK